MPDYTTDTVRSWTVPMPHRYAEVVESISFERDRRSCAWGNEHDAYRISYTTQGGATVQRTATYCFCPPCAPSPSLSQILLVSWVPWPPPTAVAVAYLLALEQEVVARIGICDQWRDRTLGNVEEPLDGRLFMQRYFAESGPGIYPAQIRETTGVTG